MTVIREGSEDFPLFSIAFNVLVFISLMLSHPLFVPLLSCVVSHVMYDANTKADATQHERKTKGGSNNRDRDKR